MRTGRDNPYIINNNIITINVWLLLLLNGGRYIIIIMLDAHDRGLIEPL